MSDTPLTYDDIEDLRYDPFANGGTGEYVPKTIGTGGNPVEVRTVPSSPPYTIKLYEVVQQSLPSTTRISPTAGGADLTEVSRTTTPGNNQYRVNYDELGNGYVEFNSAQSGTQMDIEYYGYGTTLQKIALQLRSGSTLVIGSSDSYNDRADVVIDTAQDAGAILNTWISTLNTAGGGEILLLDGTYNISTIIVVTNNITIRGQGTSTVLVKSSALVRVINMTNADNSVLRDFYLDMDDVSHTTAFYGIQDDNNKNNRYHNIKCGNADATLNTGQSMALFYRCSNMTKCMADDITGGSGTSTSAGFRECEDLVNCQAIDCNNTTGSAISGFYDCERLIDCYTNNNDYGFWLCESVGNCESQADTVNGFRGCYSLTGCYALNGATGFNSCNHMTCNRSNGNSSAQYTTCFADWAGTVAVADTAAGGWNA